MSKKENKKNNKNNQNNNKTMKEIMNKNKIKIVDNCLFK